MAEFSLQEVLLATGGKVFHAANARFNGISTDTRTLQPGNLFIALVGDNFDGHTYIGAALEKGAAGVVLSNQAVPVPADAIAVYVSDTRQALQGLARFHRQRFAVPVIAVTGSNGKTTTKDMVAAVLSVRFSTLKTEANFNNEIGLPQTLLRLQPEHQMAVVEMGMRGKGEIRELTAIALPTVGVVTTVGETHIELLGSVENIASAKAELVEAISTKGTVILNGDNSYVRAMAKLTQAKTVFFGITNGDIMAENIRHTHEGILFDCCWPGERFSIELPAVGRHNVYNALAAIAVGREFGLTSSEIRQGLLNFVPSGMRLHVESIGQFRVINDAYNASPLSMTAAIDALRDIAVGRKIAVLGDMLELGDFAVKAHRKIGEKCVENHIDFVITVGDYAKYISAAVQAGGNEAQHCADHSAARQVLRERLRSGDTVLLKGSRGMKMEQLLDVFS